MGRLLTPPTLRGQAEHRPQRQRGGDRQGRVPGLPAPGRAWRRAPGRDGVIAEPDRQAPALPQAGVILGPIGHSVALLGNVVTASGMGLERHKEFPGIVDGAAPYPTHPARPSGRIAMASTILPHRLGGDRRPPNQCAGSSWASGSMPSRAARCFPSVSPFRCSSTSGCRLLVPTVLPEATDPCNKVSSCSTWLVVRRQPADGD